MQLLSSRNQYAETTPRSPHIGQTLSDGPASSTVLSLEPQRCQGRRGVSHMGRSTDILSRTGSYCRFSLAKCLHRPHDEECARRFNFPIGRLSLRQDDAFTFCIRYVVRHTRIGPTVRPIAPYLALPTRSPVLATVNSASNSSSLAAGFVTGLLWPRFSSPSQIL